MRTGRSATSISRPKRGLAIALLPALLLGATPTPVLAAPGDAAERTTDARQREAQSRYERGVRAYSAGKYREAVDRFLEADAVLPSAPLSYNIALAYENLSDAPGALRFYRDYLRRAPGSEKAEQVQRRVAELELHLAGRGVQQVTVRSDPPGATVFIEDRPLGVTPWTGELAPGPYRLTLVLADHAPAERRIRLMPTRSLDVNLVLATGANAQVVAQTSDDGVRPPQQGETQSAAPERSGSTKKVFGPWPWITLGAGGAAFIAAGVFELQRQSAEDEARNETSQIGFAERLDAMESHQLTARILAGVGGALLITGGALVLFAPEREAEPSRKAMLGCVPGACYGSFRAAF